MIRFSSLGRSLKRRLAIAAGLLIIPLTAAQLPTVYSSRSDSADLTYSSVSFYGDSTYYDGSKVLLKTAACMGGVCYVDPPYPSEFTIRWKPDYSQILIFTYETGIGTALDSAVVDSIWTDWGYADPQAYALAIPGDPGDLAALGITSAESLLIADIIGFPYRANIGVSNMTWGTEYDSIFQFWYGAWRWADWTADSVLADSAGTVTGRTLGQWTSLYSVADSLCSAMFVEGHTYYDRMLIQYSKWWRTGDTTWLAKGDAYLRHIRDCYWEPNDGKIQPYRQFPEGIAINYLARGDTVSLRVAQQMADWLFTRYVQSGYWDGGSGGDARTQGRSAQAQFVADYLDYPDSVAYGNWRLRWAEALDSLMLYAAREQDGRPGKWSLEPYGSAHVGWQVSHTVLYVLMRYVDLVIPEDTGYVYDSTLAWATRAAQYFRDSGYVGVEPPGYIPTDTKTGDDHNVIYLIGVDTTVISPLRVFNHHDADSMVVWKKRWSSSIKWGLTTYSPPDYYLIPDTAVYRLAWEGHSHDSLSVYDGEELNWQFVHYLAHPAEHSSYWGHVNRFFSIGVQQSGMNLTLFAWLFKETGDSSYWTFADTLIEAIWYAQEDDNGDAWYYSMKLDNENYFQSDRSIYWLNNPD